MVEEIWASKSCQQESTPKSECPGSPSMFLYRTGHFLVHSSDLRPVFLTKTKTYLEESCKWLPRVFSAGAAGDRCECWFPFPAEIRGGLWKRNGKWIRKIAPGISAQGIQEHLWALSLEQADMRPNVMWVDAFSLVKMYSYWKGHRSREIWVNGDKITMYLCVSDKITYPGELQCGDQLCT